MGKSCHNFQSPKQQQSHTYLICQILLWDQFNIGPWYKKHMVPQLHNLVKLGIPTMIFFEVNHLKAKAIQTQTKRAQKKKKKRKKNIIHVAKEKQKTCPISLFRTLSADSAHFIGSFHKKGSCFRHHSIHFSQEDQQNINMLETHIPKPKGLYSACSNCKHFKLLWCSTKVDIKDVTETTTFHVDIASPSVFGLLDMKQKTSKNQHPIT